MDALRARTGLYRFIRAFMAERGVLEVDTPVMSHAGNSDTAITQFATAGQSPLWLRSSPEYPMKRLLAAGSGDIYELARVFRRGEAGRHHNPEFTLLEWYRLGFTHEQLAQETAELVVACASLHGRQWQPRRATYRELFRRHAGIDPLSADPALLAATAQRHGIDLQGADSLDRDGWLDLLMSLVVQAALPADEVTLVMDYPASQAALARIRPGNPPVAERFEVFAGSIELANGYHELTDATEQRQRFAAENRRRINAGDTPVPLDEHLLAALCAGLPECSGVALGVDRLLAACLGHARIDEVIAFPVARA
jgi:lysyl-tRNA synthetase class 2